MQNLLRAALALLLIFPPVHASAWDPEQEDPLSFPILDIAPEQIVMGDDTGFLSAKPLRTDHDGLCTSQRMFRHALARGLQQDMVFGNGPIRLNDVTSIIGSVGHTVYIRFYPCVDNSGNQIFDHDEPTPAMLCLTRQEDGQFGQPVFCAPALLEN